MSSRTLLIVVTLLAAQLAGLSTGSCAVLEEVLAVVGTRPILATDLELAELVRLVPRDAGESDAAYRSRLLSKRIELEVEVLDLESSGALYRLPVELESAVAALRARVPATVDLGQRLHAVGLDDSDLEELALRLAAVEAYSEHQLRSRLTVTMDEIDSAYHELVVAPIVAAGGAPPPLTEVRDKVTGVVVERKLNTEIERWLDDARERIDVTRYAP